jgi:hypothetical protein
MAPTPSTNGLDQKDPTFDKAIKEAGSGKFLDKAFMPEPISLIPDWNDSSEDVQ